MQTFHGSSKQVTEITSRGVFGGVFSSACDGVARSHGGVVHVITSPKPLDDYTLNYEIEGAWEMAIEVCDGDEEQAEAIMKPACPCDSCDSEDGWELQRLRGVLAARLGYTSVEMEDEHCTTWLCLPGCTVEPA